jgi:hypothetical protein
MVILSKRFFRKDGNPQEPSSVIFPRAEQAKKEGIRKIPNHETIAQVAASYE